MFTGFADTPQPDPYAPDGCWDGDGLVAHVSLWKNGELSDLGVLDAGPNSESNWLSENGLIAGDSQNGLLDPLVGAWQIRGVLWMLSPSSPCWQSPLNRSLNNTQERRRNNLDTG
jgi:hypothetical protein